MTIQQLIDLLLENNDPDDEIIAVYWDKDYFKESMDNPDDVDSVWSEFVQQGTETVMGHLDFTGTGYDLKEELEELIQEKQEENK